MFIDVMSLVVIGAVAACVLQALQRYGRIPSFYNVKLFFGVILLSSLCWIISLAVGGWGGLSLTAIGLNGLVAAVSGLVCSFLLNILLRDG
ncbi:hypothetical protein N5C46_09590 [Rossellomorea vietnamensis]|uniref:Uncharacterized protein n=1 Tax=Rossellomorea vietnamensis TaxID=218284 RepID=A0ACD4CC64_9BACI|nr:hypothetical protein [Rossellomorea vietnamensis]UXH46274.1 hypothetical protein N5C46_09590 [Rossellomorea vietnamensis]